MYRSYLAFFIALVAQLPTASAQTRYLDEVFATVELAADIEYGSNATALYFPGTGEFEQEALLVDVYQPEDDTATARPLAILLHTGNFLPVDAATGVLQGSKSDSALVYLAGKLAQRGYVVASMDFRLGWAPTEPDPLIRRLTLSHALYRGIQDVNTCVRYFKRFAGDYEIDPDKILLWGDGSGGIMAWSAATLDEFEEWAMPQFILNVQGVPQLMVDEAVLGDVFGTNTGIVPPNHYLSFLPEGDTLCYPNHPGYSSEVRLAVSMSGGLVDTSWADPGEPALLGFHALPDPFMPYQTCSSACLPGGLPSGEPVLTACGSWVTMTTANEKGNNAIFTGLEFPGDFSEVANSRNDGVDGLFPLSSIENTPVDVDYPWQWWSEDLAPGSPSAESAKLHLDTMLAYVAPRACLALGLDCAGLTSLAEPLSTAEERSLRFIPNPASTIAVVMLPANAEEAGFLMITDDHGQTLFQTTLEHRRKELNLAELAPGIYFVRWTNAKQTYAGKLVRL